LRTTGESVRASLAGNHDARAERAECQIRAREVVAVMRAETSSVKLGMSDGDSTVSASAQKSLQ